MTNTNNLFPQDATPGAITPDGFSPGLMPVSPNGTIGQMSRMGGMAQPSSNPTIRAGSYGTSVSNNSSVVVSSLPPGWQPGDVAFLIIRFGQVSTTFTQTGGTGTWTQELVGSNTTGGYSYGIYYRTLALGDTAPTFTASNSNSWNYSISAFYAPSGSLTINNWSTLNEEATAGNTIATNSATSSSATDLSVILVCGRASAVISFSTFTDTPPTGWSIASGSDGESGSGSNARLAGTWYNPHAGAGTISPGSGSWTDSGSNTFYFDTLQATLYGTSVYGAVVGGSGINWRNPRQIHRAVTRVNSHYQPLTVAGATGTVNVVAVAGTTTISSNPVNGSTQSPATRQPRRRSSRAVTRVNSHYQPLTLAGATGTVNVVAAPGGAASGPISGATGTVNVVAVAGSIVTLGLTQPTQPLSTRQPPRRKSTRGFWLGNSFFQPLTVTGATGTINVVAPNGSFSTSAGPVNGSTQPLATRQQPRRKSARAVWRGNDFYQSLTLAGATSTINVTAVAGSIITLGLTRPTQPLATRQPPRRKSARAVWHGNSYFQPLTLAGATGTVSVFAIPGGAGSGPISGVAGTVNVVAVPGSIITLGLTLPGQPQPTRQPRRKSARAVWLGADVFWPVTVAGATATVNAVAVAGTALGGVTIAGVTATANVVAPAGSITTLGLTPPGQPLTTRQPRRKSARAVWRGNSHFQPVTITGATGTINVVAVSGGAAAGPISGATGAVTVNAIAGSIVTLGLTSPHQPQPTRQPRRKSARAVTRSNAYFQPQTISGVTGTVNATAVAGTFINSGGNVIVSGVTGTASVNAVAGSVSAVMSAAGSVSVSAIAGSVLLGVTASILTQWTATDTVTSPSIALEWIVGGPGPGKHIGMASPNTIYNVDRNPRTATGNQISTQPAERKTQPGNVIPMMPEED